MYPGPSSSRLLCCCTRRPQRLSLLLRSQGLQMSQHCQIAIHEPLYAVLYAAFFSICQFARRDRSRYAFLEACFSQSVDGCSMLVECMLYVINESGSKVEMARARRGHTFLNIGFLALILKPLLKLLLLLHREAIDVVGRDVKLLVVHFCDSRKCFGPREIRERRRIEERCGKAQQSTQIPGYEECYSAVLQQISSIQFDRTLAESGKAEPEPGGTISPQGGEMPSTSFPSIFFACTFIIPSLNLLSYKTISHLIAAP
jgi:hypothetical protein